MLEKTIETKYALEAPSYRCAACEAEVPPGEPYLSAVLFDGEAFQRREFCPGCWKGSGSGGPQDPGDVEDVFACWRTRRPVPEEAPPRRRRFDVELLWSFFRRLEHDLAAEDAGLPPAPVAPTEDVATEDVAAEDAAAEDAAAEDAAAEDAAAEDAAPAGDGIAAPIGGRLEKVRVLFLVGLLLVRVKKLVLDGTALRDGREWLKLSEKIPRSAGSVEPARFLVENPGLGEEDLVRVKETLGDLLQMEI